MEVASSSACRDYISRSTMYPFLRLFFLQMTHRSRLKGRSTFETCITGHLTTLTGSDKVTIIVTGLKSVCGRSSNCIIGLFFTEGKLNCVKYFFLPNTMPTLLKFTMDKNISVSFHNDGCRAENGLGRALCGCWIRYGAIATLFVRSPYMATPLFLSVGPN
jgi:hypothetical protein